MLATACLLPSAAGVSNAMEVEAETAQEAQPPAAQSDISWVGKAVTDEINKNTEGAKTIGMPVLFGTRYTAKGDIETALRGCPSVKALADYQGRIDAGGLLLNVAWHSREAHGPRRVYAKPAGAR